MRTTLCENRPCRREFAVLPGCHSAFCSLACKEEWEHYVETALLRQHVGTTISLADARRLRLLAKRDGLRPSELFRRLIVAYLKETPDEETEMQYAYE